MKQNYKKIAFWFAGTASYFLAVAVVLAMLLDADMTETGNRIALAEIAHSEEAYTLVEELAAASPGQGVFMPIGPDDTYLPGLPEVWDELIKASEVSSLGKDVNGFDSLQMVRDFSDLGRGAIAEIFISNQPVSVARVDNRLLILNDNGRVQVVDCERPATPVLLDPLPFPPVEKMVVEGAKAFLLFKNNAQLKGEMIVLDLSTPDEIKELARLAFPAPVLNFFFINGQFVTYESRGSLKQSQFLNVYNLSKDYELHLKTKIKSPIIDRSAVLVGQHLVTPDLRDGLNIVNMNAFQEPLPIVRLPLNGQVRRLARFGDQLFAVGPKGQLYVVDLHNLEYPALDRLIMGTTYHAYYLNVGDYSYCFSDNGYLHVYDTPVGQVARLQRNTFVPFQGILAETPDKQSFLFLDNYSLISHADEAFPVGLAKTTDVVAVTTWGEFNVWLDKDGGLSFLRTEKDGSLSLEKRVVLPGQSRWLAAGESYLYAGGGSLEVIGHNDSGEIAHLGTATVPAVESSDAVVVGGTLFVAAHSLGLMQYSLKDPLKPENIDAVNLPVHLDSLVDVRQLSLHGERLLAAAGPAGLLVIVPAQAGGFFEGGMMFDEALVALTTINDFCLVSDQQAVHVVNLREEGSLQKLGEVAFRGVERFAVASNGVWAGYVQEEGWTLLPVPHIVTSAELKELVKIKAFSDKEVARYRLSMFDDNGVIGIPGVLSMAALSEVRLSGEDHAAN